MLNQSTFLSFERTSSLLCIWRRGSESIACLQLQATLPKHQPLPSKMKQVCVLGKKRSEAFALAFQMIDGEGRDVTFEVMESNA